MNILLTGGAGYIGTHTLIELIKNNHTAVVVDNLSNSSEEALYRVEEITGVKIPFYQIDVCDKEALETVFSKHHFDAVIHFAGLKAVGESVANPLLYYRNNIDCTLTLLEVMKQYKVKKLVFSSSATVYGSAPIPYGETSQTGVGVTNPYGRSKYIIEEIMRDVATADDTNEFTSLRYFNPIGAHTSGRVGEHPDGIPNNLMPYITQVAVGSRDKLAIFGDDYETADGTGARDYIHVMDLADGHVAALTHSRPGFTAYNLGSGNSTTVLELVHAFEKASEKHIPYEISARRDGDLPEYYAVADKAKRDLDWSTKRDIDTACQDSWRWQSQNPNGYDS